MGGLGSRLKLVKSYYELSSVKVVFLRDHPELPTLGGVLNVKKGDELELPRWQAKMLATKGYVEVKDSQVDIDYVNYVHYHEVKKHAANKIVDVNPHFYMKIKELIEEIDRALLERPSHMLVTDRESIERKVMQIAQRRLSKMVRLVMSGGGDEVKDKLTPEEAILMRSLESSLEAWNGYIAGLFSKEVKRSG